MAKRNDPIISKLSLWSLIIIFALSFWGCVAFRSVYPINEDPKKDIIIFENYKLEICGWSGHSSVELYQFQISVSFIDSIDKSTPEDSIPIFAIDSLCFYLPCADSSFCVENKYLENDAQEIKGWREAKLMGRWTSVKIAEDLTFSGGKYYPSNFYLKTGDGICIPIDCENTTLFFTARLLDRVSKTEIRRKDKRIPMRVHRQHVSTIGS